MNPRYGELLHRAKLSDLSRDEIDSVAEELRHPRADSDLYYPLAILGEAGATWHRDLVEAFLEEGNDPWLAREALEVLCLDWGEATQYLEPVVRFIAGVPWDEMNWIKLMAISIAGEFLRDQAEPRLLRELLRIFDEHPSGGIVGSAAYHALARALGRPRTSVVSMSPLDPSVIEDAKQRLAVRGG